MRIFKSNTKLQPHQRDWQIILFSGCCVYMCVTHNIHTHTLAIFKTKCAAKTSHTTNVLFGIYLNRKTWKWKVTQNSHKYPRSMTLFVCFLVYTEIAVCNINMKTHTITHPLAWCDWLRCLCWRAIFHTELNAYYMQQHQTTAVLS